MNDKSVIFCRNNFLHSKTKQAERRKVQAPLVVDDFRVAVVKGNVTAVQKFLDNGKFKMHPLLPFPSVIIYVLHLVETVHSKNSRGTENFLDPIKHSLTTKT